VTSDRPDGVEVALSRDELRSRVLKWPDAWWVVLVVDPVVMRILPWTLKHPRITPNKITLTGSALGCFAIAAFATGHLVVGALLFEARFFLDCLDGKVARARGWVSDRGAFLDMSLDVALITSAIAALAWHLSPGAGASGPTVPLLLSCSTVVTNCWLMWLILWDLDHPAPSRAPQSSSASWLRRRRLYRRPRTVEIETLLLFIAPLTGSELVLRGSYAIALMYFVLACINLAARLYRSSAGVDYARNKVRITRGP
jgi:phosphatidylglycerophosphate synthase